VFSAIKRHWKLSRLFAQRDKVRRKFRESVENARKAGKSHEALDDLNREAWAEDGMITDEIERFITDHLVTQANRLFIPIPERTEEAMWRESSYGEGALAHE
jgi:hypothetical protein